jgi:cell division septation protein DedD
MKKILLTVHIIAFMICSATAQEQTPATEAGEDFDLYGVIGLFEESEDFEDFEKKINSEENDVNNLDLNKDEEVDIVKVVEYEEGNTHVLALQAVIGDNDFQDIATIEIEKHSESEISLQVIGDPDIYGTDYIIEPAPEEGSIRSYRPMAVFVSVHTWRPIGFVYRPGRVVFVSAVVFRPAPVWFRVRRPIGRSSWRGKSKRWHSPRYRTSKSRHSRNGRNMYSSKRKTSPKAKSNFGSSPSPAKSTAASPSNQKKTSAKTSQTNQQKKATTSPGKSTSTNKAASPSKQQKKGASPQKKKKH